MLAIALMVALAAPPDVDKTLDATTTTTVRDLLVARCVETAHNGHAAAVHFGSKWYLRADKQVFLTTKKGDKPAWDNRITLTFSDVDVDALLKANLLPFLMTGLGNCTVKEARLAVPPELLGKPDEQQRWQNDVVSALYAFRVETAPKTFQYLAFDGTQFVRAPSPIH